MDLRKRKAVDDLNIRYPKMDLLKRKAVDDLNIRNPKMDLLKRKAVDDLNTVMKIMKITELKQKRKLYYIERKSKKQRTCNCILHEEKYICDIYECNGKINRDNFMCK